MSFTKIDNNNIAPTGVTAGSYTNANITVNESGQITSASNGVAGTGGGGGGGTGLQHTTYTYTANGSTTTFAATSGITVHTVLVILDGVTQMPTTDYTVSGSNVIFTSAPPANSVIQIRVLGDVASSGGGPKISNIAITDSNWDALDDTAVDIAGGYIKITGTGFVSGCLAYFNQTAAASISFVSSTELRISTGVLAASTYVLYVINPDGGVAISVPGVTFSATPAWQTASTLSDQYDGVAITLSLVAQDATSYTLVSGSLPPGLSLNTSTGAITGTVTGVTVDTTYTFTVRATDAQLQDSPRTFTVTITVSDPYFNRTTLLLSGSAISANTVIRDSSTNNFNLTAFGDARASNFSPYGTGWSNYFDGSGDYLSLANNAAFDMGSSDFTIDCWFYLTGDASPDNDGLRYASIFSSGPSTATNSTDYSISIIGNTTTTGTGIGFGGRNSGTLYNLTYTTTITKNIWHYVCVVRSGSTLTLYYDGTQVAQNTSFTSNVNTGGNQIRIGALAWFPSGQNYAYYFPGYISALKVVKGVANTPSGVPSTPPTQSTGTSLLTCNANRFLDSSSNGFAITPNGDAKVVSFNPFGITNTGVNGSAYFDGTGDYLTVPQNTAFAFGTGDFTVEFWVNVSTYRTTLGGYYDCFLALGNYVDSPYFRIISSGTAEVGLVANSLSGTTVFKANTWYHYAVSRSGTTARLFINGVLESTVTNSSNLANGTAVYIGTSQWNVANETMTGLLSDLRIVKGTAIYTSNFTPPTAPLTAVTNTQLLTCQYKQPYNNHTFLDASSNQFVVTRSGNTTQGTFSPFSQTGWGNYFDGTGDFLSSSGGTATAMGTGDFTWELFAYIPAATGYQGFIDTRSNPSAGSTDGFGFLLNTGTLTPVVNTSSNVLTSSVNIVANAWNHIALTRSGTTLTVWVNGASGGSTTNSTNLTNQSFSIGGFSVSPNAYLTGYLSNIRITKGGVLYTTAFTPPTSPLTTTVSSGTVSLLTCQSNRFIDNSTNNFTITRNGDTRVINFSPFAPTAVYSPAVHGGSAYFDGSGDYLSFVNNNQINFGSSPFTIEVWFYSVSTNTRQDFITQWATNNKSSYLGIGAGTASRIQFVYSTTGGNELAVTDTTNFVPYQWYHVAACRTANTISLFVNGVRVATTTETGAIFNSTRTPITVGAYSGNSGEEGSVPLVGYLSGLRVIKGSSVYDATQTSITVPAVPVSSTSNTQLLLNFTDAAILDSTGRNAIETSGDAKVTTVQTKFGTSSQFYNGSNTNLVVPVQPYFSFPGTTSFTVEAWVYFNDLNTQLRPLIALGDGANGLGPIYNAWSMQYWGTEGSNQIGWGRYDGTSYNYLTSGLILVANTWYHIAVSRDSTNTLRIFVNGVSYYSATVTQTFAQVNSNPLRIGLCYNGPASGYGGPRYFNGYIDGIRITRGYARYTANFTAPTAPHRLK